VLERARQELVATRAGRVVARSRRREVFRLARQVDAAARVRERDVEREAALEPELALLRVRVDAAGAVAVVAVQRVRRVLSSSRGREGGREGGGEGA
jgi:hypothetical protein